MGFAMGERYTRKDADRAFVRLCEELGKPVGHYREVGESEASNMANGQRFSTIPGGWALDYNPTYGRCVIEELSPNPGETWISHPLGSTRRSPREFVQNDFVAWSAELDDVPGVFSGLCQMDALDWLGAERFVEWLDREEGTR